MPFSDGQKVTCVNDEFTEGKFTIGEDYIIQRPVIIDDPERLETSDEWFCTVADDQGKEILLAKSVVEEKFVGATET
ncbi:hypothetical protein ACFL5V_06225 [Fibrobacterota bacterium]